MCQGAKAKKFAALKRNCWQLAPHESGVQAAGHGGVGGPFDDGAPVGEEGHLIGLSPELQNEIIVAHWAVGTQALTHQGQVYGPLTLMDLD